MPSTCCVTSPWSTDFGPSLDDEELKARATAAIAPATFFLCLYSIAGAALLAACDDRSEVPESLLNAQHQPPTAEASSTQESRRPTTQQLMEGERRRIQADTAPPLTPPARSRQQRAHTAIRPSRRYARI